ncbi:MAG: SH3 domain-containing protein [Planctomycetota bacterium]
MNRTATWLIVASTSLPLPAALSRAQAQTPARAPSSSLPTNTPLADETPFDVFVVQEQAYAYSGPSSKHYRTDSLRHGQQLEVYLQVDGGWLGIRPPKGSFSWLPADTVTVEPDGETAVVNHDQTVVWVGTQLGKAPKSGWQVRLDAGEIVTILGRNEGPGPAGPTEWLRIIPPNGEFRFVHQSEVVRTSEELIASLQVPSEPQQTLEMSRRSTEFDQDEVIGSGIARASAESSSVLSQVGGSDVTTLTPTQPPMNLLPPPIRQASAQEDILNASDKDASDSKNPASGLLASIAKMSRATLAPLKTFNETTAPWQQVTGPTVNLNSGLRPPPMPAQTLSPSTASISPMQSTGSQRPPRQVSVETLRSLASRLASADLDQLQLALSELMSRNASDLEVRMVEEAARKWSLQTTDLSLAQQASDLAGRAGSYAAIARRREPSVIAPDLIGTVPVASNNAFAAATTQPSFGNVQAAGFATPPTVQPMVPSSTAPASPPGQVHLGQLVEVYSSRPHSPPFALTDASGRTTAYVTPSPGINLRRHLGKWIRVNGDVSQAPELDLPHVVAFEAQRQTPSEF